MRRGIAKRQRCRQCDFSQFEIATDEAGQRVKQVGFFIVVGHAVCQYAVHTLIEGVDHGLVAQVEINGQPFLKKFDFSRIDRAIGKKPSSQADEFINLPRREPIAVQLLRSLKPPPSIATNMDQLGVESIGCLLPAAGAARLAWRRVRERSGWRKVSQKQKPRILFGIRGFLQKLVPRRGSGISAISALKSLMNFECPMASV